MRAPQPCGAGVRARTSTNKSSNAPNRQVQMPTIPRNGGIFFWSAKVYAREMLKEHFCELFLLNGFHCYFFL